MSGRAARASKARKRWHQSESKAWEWLPEHGPFTGEHNWSDIVAWQSDGWLQYPQYEPKRRVRTVVSFYVVPEKAP